MPGLCQPRHTPVAAALKQVIASHALTAGGGYYFLPSMMTLGERLDCSALEVHLALRELQGHGYRFLVLGPESPITLWRMQAA